MEEWVSKIKYWAIDCHESTNHRYGNDEPYSVHLNMVYDFAVKYNFLLGSVNDTYVAFAAAYAHDVIEDCRKTYNDVKQVCGERVADVVYALTNEKGKNRRERANDKYYAEIKRDDVAWFVKICDRLANIKYSSDHGSRMLDAYRKESNHFREQLFDPMYSPMFDEMDQYLFP